MRCLICSEQTPPPYESWFDEHYKQPPHLFEMWCDDCFEWTLYGILRDYREVFARLAKT